MFFTILLGLLAVTPATYAASGSSGLDSLGPQELERAFGAHARRDDPHKHNLKLVSRQSFPPLTSVPDCTLYDGYFYVTPRNYTWQLQCSNSFDGTVVAQTTDTTDLSSCITECVDYNRANTPGACVAVTFSGSYSTADTVCTQYSSIDAINIASEEGGVVNSALLILGPSGQIFATPQPEPTFIGAPTLPPMVDPLPSQTTTSTLQLTMTDPPAVITSYLASTTTTTSTSTVVITSCLAGQSCQPSTMSTSLPSGSGALGGTGSQTTSQLSINISDGGSRPVTSITVTSSMGTGLGSMTSGAATVDAGLQSTFTTIVPYTEYRVQIIEICAATPAPCSQSATTATNVAYRTEISCSPGVCKGVALTTGYLVDAIAAATCVVVT